MPDGDLHRAFIRIGTGGLSDRHTYIHSYSHGDTAQRAVAITDGDAAD